MNHLLKRKFLNQAQETSCGNVVYTGMNDKGDFYIGNTKIASASGQQTTFDIPVATVTGEDPNRLSAVFDEVVIKERLLVEGGASKQILSQFDGAVTFNSDLDYLIARSNLLLKHHFVHKMRSLEIQVTRLHLQMDQLLWMVVWVLLKILL